MKCLLLACILGFVSWLGSEILELAQGGYTPLVYYLTAAYHVLAGFGFWGLHRHQAQSKNVLSLMGTILISATYFALAWFPIAVMHSGVSVAEYLSEHPVYKIPGVLSLLGFLVFGAAVIRSRIHPRWTGVVIVFGTLLYAFAMAKGLQVLVNLNSIVIAATVIFMCASALRQSSVVGGPSGLGGRGVRERG